MTFGPNLTEIVDEHVKAFARAAAIAVVRELPDDLLAYHVIDIDTRVRESGRIVVVLSSDEAAVEKMNRVFNGASARIAVCVDNDLRYADVVTTRFDIWPDQTNFDVYGNPEKKKSQEQLKKMN